MTVLIVTAHPDPDSLTHEVAARLGALLVGEQPQFAHLAQEHYDPRFTADDRDLYRGAGQRHPSVLREQERLDAVTDVVLVFPMYWWSMPALLKGWIDRTFIAGWAFDEDGGRVRPRLQHLTMHLIPLTGTAEESFARHGYATSFTTQIEQGIIGFCGMRHGTTAFLHESESTDRSVLEAAVVTVTARVESAIPRTARSERNSVSRRTG